MVKSHIANVSHPRISCTKVTFECVEANWRPTIPATTTEPIHSTGRNDPPNADEIKTEPFDGISGSCLLVHHCRVTKYTTRRLTTARRNAPYTRTESLRSSRGG